MLIVSLLQVLSYLLDIFLYGILIAQIYQYYSAFPNDRIWQKCLVYTSFTLCTFQSVLYIRDIYIKLGQGFGNINVLSKLSLGMKFMPLSTGAVSGAVQIFYAYQISVVSQSKYLAGIVTALSLFQIVVSFYQSIRLIIIVSKTSVLVRKSYLVSTIWLVASATCDIVIAIIMTFYLLRADARYKKSRAPLRKLTRLIIETGIAFSATWGTVATALFCSSADSFAQIFIRTLGKIYLSTLLVILNSRVDILGGREQDQLEVHSLSAIAPTS
ncbi:hypothetical protein K435DRAFT_654509 [Dendrothele bispora CBS 962.96]|uniref:DUF6534 domain-containing protein n=1 Tax=Dendrothele bispora (strain CBS 962.96) TaxID=1314807 RepID=A0A4S8MGZ9_DENBC|nr:hypothetical protein K435DRAFT_654509 [Dendrothele bispora CBS 962.96]